jgi:hypothetical protein
MVHSRDPQKSEGKTVKYVCPLRNYNHKKVYKVYPRLLMVQLQYNRLERLAGENTLGSLGLLVSYEVNELV